MDESNRKPGSFNNVPITYNEPWDAVRPDGTAANDFISKTLGIKFAHWVALPDPLYKLQQGDLRQTFNHEDNQQFVDDERFERENEFIYIKKGEVFGIFQSNSKDLKSVLSGLYSDSGATISLNRFYVDSDEKIKVAENDKLIPCELPSEFFSVDYQTLIHNPTGIDRVQFPICDVEYLFDSSGVQYFQGQDFEIFKGTIKWINGGNRPGLDKITGSGKLLSIRYLYKPYYYIKTVLHDIRIRPVLTNMGEVTAKSGPVLVVAQADWVYLDRRTASGDNNAAQLEAATGENTGPR